MSKRTKAVEDYEDVVDDGHSSDCAEPDRNPAPVAAKKRKTKKQKKDPNAPKRPQSAFFLYMNGARAEFKASNPGLSHKESTSKISETWNAMDARGKASYVERANAAKAEYNVALDKYKEESGLNLKKDAPKRPLTSFMLYLNDNRARIKEENEGIKFGQVSKHASVEWKALDPKAKTPFEKRNAQLKKDYEVNIAAYKALHPEYGKKAPKTEEAAKAPLDSSDGGQDYNAVGGGEADSEGNQATYDAYAEGNKDVYYSD